MDYYHLTAEALGENAKLCLDKRESSEAVFRALAREMTDEIRRHNEAGEPTVLICPVGPVGQYPFFVEQVNREKLSLRDVFFINMDEYLTDADAWIDPKDRLSFRGFMQRAVYDRVLPELIMPPEQRVFPDPRDPGRVERLIARLGGVDICLGGIGINGHLAFNEPQPGLTPEAFARLETRVLDISPETRAVNAIGDLNGAIEAMPRRCITIGIASILAARKVRLGVFREWHRAAVRRAAYGEVSAAFPATLLQGHPDAKIYVNDVAAQRAF